MIGPSGPVRGAKGRPLHRYWTLAAQPAVAVGPARRSLCSLVRRPLNGSIVSQTWETPMGTRKELLEYLWSNVINSSLATSGLKNIVASSERRPDDPFSDAGAAIKRILAAGGTSEDIALIRRAAAY